MSRTEESFFAKVYALVRCIPRRRVATYGQVAAMLGVVRGARAVGWALRALPEERAARVPWHRVVGAGGRISPRPGPGPEIQRRRLRAEGVAFRGAHVDMARHGLMHGSFSRPRERPREGSDLDRAEGCSGHAGGGAHLCRSGVGSGHGQRSG